MTSRRTAGLGPEDRLRRSGDFDRVLRAGFRVTDPALSLRWVGRAAPGQRLGIVIPRDRGPAVLRNRIRRVIREFFRLSRGAFPDQVDVAIVVRRGVDLRTWKPLAIREAISQLAARARAAQRKSGEAH